MIEGRVRIGVIGRLRYPRSMLPLVEAIADRPDHYELHVFGFGPLEVELRNRSRQHSNVHFHGPFEYPGDLPGIYEMVDLVFSVYDNSDENVRLAIPNKLFEALYFATPIVVATGTRLGERVRSMGVGYLADPREPEFAKRLLDNLDPADILARAETALKLDIETLSAGGGELRQVLDRLARPNLPFGGAGSLSIRKTYINTDR